MGASSLTSARSRIGNLHVGRHPLDRDRGCGGGAHRITSHPRLTLASPETSPLSPTPFCSRTLGAGSSAPRVAPGRIGPGPRSRRRRPAIGRGAVAVRAGRRRRRRQIQPEQGRGRRLAGVQGSDRRPASVAPRGDRSRSSVASMRAGGRASSSATRPARHWRKFALSATRSIAGSGRCSTTWSGRVS
jgi:hypothetical protein